MAVQDRYPHYLADQKQHFDELVTEDWDSYQQKRIFQLWEFETTRLMKTVRPATILNLGCGCGYHGLAMAQYPFVRRIDGVDYSAKSVEKAEAHYSHPKVNRRVCDFRDLPKGSPYDLVVSYQVIEHLEDGADFLLLCSEHVKPGGVVAVYTVNKWRPYNRIMRKQGKEPVLDDPMHKQEFSAKELVELGRQAGLEKRKVFHYAISHPWKHCHGLGLWIGYWMPWKATRLAAIFKKPEAGE